MGQTTTMMISSLLLTFTALLAPQFGVSVPLGSQQADVDRYNIYSVDYNLNGLSASERTVDGNRDMVRNANPTPVSVQLSSTVTSDETYQWGLNDGVSGTTTAVRAGVPVYIGGSWAIDSDVKAYSYSYPGPARDAVSFTKSGTYEIPPANQCTLSTYMVLSDVTIPYTGELRITLTDGSATTEDVSNTYTGAVLTEANAIFECQPV